MHVMPAFNISWGHLGNSFDTQTRIFHVYASETLSPRGFFKNKVISIPLVFP